MYTKQIPQTVLEAELVGWETTALYCQVVAPRAGRRCLQVQSLDLSLLLGADAHEVAEVLERNGALAPDAKRLLAALAQLLDGAINAYAQAIGRNA